MTERFTTTDGVELGYDRHGAKTSGPPLLLVHGGMTDKGCFAPILPLLAQHREVIAYDRRGRGTSGDGAVYEVQRDMLDLAEIAAFAGNGKPVDVFGYSYGGMLALSLAASDEGAKTIKRLAVYEPPFSVPGMFAEGLVDDVERLIKEGEGSGALRRFVSGTFHLPEPVVAAMERHPAWAASLAALPTFGRESDAVESLAPPDKLNPDIAVLYIVGDNGGNPAFADIANRVAKANPNVRTAAVGGIPHFAIATEPQRMAELLLDFFDGPGASA
jgi:pimeloyl-ACP methyl ester carboxylesterase